MTSNEKKIETLKGKIEKKQLEMAAADNLTIWCSPPCKRKSPTSKPK